MASYDDDFGFELLDSRPIRQRSASRAVLDEPESIEQQIRRVALTHGLDPELAVSVARQESNLNPNAVGDGGRAIGLFQVHAAAAQDVGEDRHTVDGNIRAGVKYLKQNLDRFGGNVEQALQAYNGGASRVERGTVSSRARAYAQDVAPADQEFELLDSRPIAQSQQPATPAPAPSDDDFELLDSRPIPTPTAAPPPPAPVAPPEPELPTRSLGQARKDIEVSLAKGIVGAGQGFVGLADLITPGNLGAGLKGLGLDLEGAQQYLESQHSPQQQAAIRNVGQAEGVIGTLKAAAENPTAVAGMILESLPSMAGGGAIGRMATLLARVGTGAKVGAAVGRVAGGIGEGAISAGQYAESTRAASPTGELTGKETAAAIGQGVTTGALGVFGSKMAKALKVADIDSMFAGAATSELARKRFLSAFFAGAISEGLMEEFPQSISEQVWANYAAGRDPAEGLANAAVLGTIAGMVMGGPFAAIENAGRPTQQTIDAQEGAKRERETIDLTELPGQREPSPFEEEDEGPLPPSLAPGVADLSQVTGEPDIETQEPVAEPTTKPTGERGMLYSTHPTKRESTPESERQAEALIKTLRDGDSLIDVAGRRYGVAVDESGQVALATADGNTVAEATFDDESWTPEHQAMVRIAERSRVERDTSARGRRQEPLAGREPLTQPEGSPTRAAEREARIYRRTLEMSPGEFNALPDDQLVEVGQVFFAKPGADRGQVWAKVSEERRFYEQKRRTEAETGFDLTQLEGQRGPVAPERAAPSAPSSPGAAAGRPPVLPGGLARTSTALGGTPPVSTHPLAPAAIKENVTVMPVAQIHADPDRLQYKGKRDAAGVTAEGRIEGPWEKWKEGIILVWKDPADGKTYVVNGHHRLEAAKRLGVENIAVRFLDVGSAKDALILGAMTNIVDEKGTAQDVAKILRTGNMGPDDFKRFGLTTRNALVRDGISLAKVSDATFRKVVNEDITTQVGAAIGEAGLTEDQEFAAIKWLGRLQKRKGTLTKGQVDSILEEVKTAPQVEKTDDDQPDLFGNKEEENVAEARAMLRAWLRGRLKEDKALFNAVLKKKRAERLKEMGIGEIDAAKAGEGLDEASILQETFEDLVKYKGPIADALTQAAVDLKQGKNEDATRTALYEAVTAAVNTELGRPGKSGQGRGGVPPTGKGEGDKPTKVKPPEAPPAETKEERLARKAREKRERKEGKPPEEPPGPPPTTPGPPPPPGPPPGPPAAPPTGKPSKEDLQRRLQERRGGPPRTLTQTPGEGAPPAEETEEKWWEKTQRQVAERNATAKGLAEAGHAVRLRDKAGAVALAGRDPSKPGSFRVTWFDAEGQLWGHSEEPTLEKAIVRAMEEGFTPQPSGHPLASQAKRVKMKVDEDETIDILASSLYVGQRPQIIATELLQNSLDEMETTFGQETTDAQIDTYTGSAPKPGQKVPAGALSEGEQAYLDSLTPEQRAATEFIEVRDNGRGMTPEFLETVFVTISGSGKREDVAASGGFGFAKAAFLAAPNYVKVESVTEANGRKIRSVLEGSKSDKEGFTLQDPEVLKRSLPWQRDKTTTGTVIRTWLTPREGERLHIWIVGTRAQEIAKKSLKASGTKIASSSYPAYGTQTWEPRAGSFDTKTTTAAVSEFDLLSTREVPGSRIEIYRRKNDKPTTVSAIAYPILNNRMATPITSVISGGLGSPDLDLPTDIRVNVIPTVKEKDPLYPFTANRESLRGDVSEAITEVLQKEIYEPIANKYNAAYKDVWKDLTEVKGAHQSYIYDTGGRLTQAEQEQLAKMPVLRELFDALNEVNDWYRDLKAKLKAARKPMPGNRDLNVAKIGLLFDNGKASLGETESSTFGLHVTIPFDHLTSNAEQVARGTAHSSMALFNLGRILHGMSDVGEIHPGEEGYDEELAGLIHHTFLHELNHSIVSEEGPGFTFAFLRLSGYATGRVAFRQQQRIRFALAGRGAELDELLRLYREAGKRPDTRPNFLSGDFARDPFAKQRGAHPLAARAEHARETDRGREAPSREGQEDVAGRGPSDTLYQQDSSKEDLADLIGILEYEIADGATDPRKTWQNVRAFLGDDLALQLRYEFEVAWEELTGKEFDLTEADLAPAATPPAAPKLTLDTDPRGQEMVGYKGKENQTIREAMKSASWVTWIVQPDRHGRAKVVGDIVRALQKDYPESVAPPLPDKEDEAVITADDQATLTAQALTGEASGTEVRVRGKRTFQLREMLVEYGGQARKTVDALTNRDVWTYHFLTSQFKRLITALKSLPAYVAGTREADYLSDPALRAARRAADAIPDVSALPDTPENLLDPETITLIQKGLAKGMPEVVVNEQIEDIARMTDAYEKKRPMYLLASEPGSGKTFVLGGVIRELRRKGVERFVYVTTSQALISQVKKNLSAYGIGDVEFMTYAALREGQAHASDVLIFDEAHNIKNINADTAQAIQGAEWIHAARYTIFASATPFEDPTEAEYLQSTGLFEQEPFGDFLTWARSFGAGVFLIKRRDGSIRKVPTWTRTTTSDNDAKAAREWFRKQGMYTSRRIRLPADMVDSRLISVSVDEDKATRYEQFTDVADEMKGNGELPGFSWSWVTNFQKRLLEEAKVEIGIREAESAIKRGRFPVLFIETKAERIIDIPKVLRREAQYREAVQEALMMGERPPKRKGFGPDDPDGTSYLKPEGIAELLGGYMRVSGERTIEIPGVEERIINHFGKENVAIYTGTPTDKQAQQNLADWREGKPGDLLSEGKDLPPKRLLLVTMAKGGTGLSLHDEVGDHPTTQINISLPWTATKVAQVAQRTTRYGLQSLAEQQWIFADNIPFDQWLARKVGGRMANMGALVHGERPKGSKEIEDFNFEDVAQSSLPRPRPFTVKMLQAIFDLTPDQALVVYTLAEKMGLPLERIRLVRGGDLNEYGDTLDQADQQRGFFDEELFDLEDNQAVGGMDTLPTGEQQPRLPGDVGAVREKEIETPLLPLPEPEFRLTAETAKGKKKKASPALFDKLFQAVRQRDAKGKPKASVTFLDDGKALTRALTDPDVSSPLHELAHIARRFLLNREVPAELRQGITDADIDTVEREMGVVNGEWTDAAEELFARMFERYLRDGPAPSTPTSMHSILAKIAAWMTEIYQTIKGSEIHVDVTPKMREVFDRLVTRQERLAAKETPKATSADIQQHLLAGGRYSYTNYAKRTSEVYLESTQPNPNGTHTLKWGPGPGEVAIESLASHVKQIKGWLERGMATKIEGAAPTGATPQTDVIGSDDEGHPLRIGDRITWRSPTKGEILRGEIVGTKPNSIIVVQLDGKSETRQLKPWDKRQFIEAGSRTGKGGRTLANVDRFRELEASGPAPGGQSRGQQGLPGTPTTPSSVPPGTSAIHPLEIPEIVEFGRDLGIRFHVRVRKGDRHGSFHPGRGTITLAADLFEPGNFRQLLGTIAHEIGHAVDWFPDLTVARGNILGHILTLHNFLRHTFTSRAGTVIEKQQVMDELKALSAYWRPWKTNPSPQYTDYRNSPRELYADAISALLNDPNLLATMAPTFYEEFFAELDRKPGVEAEYFALQQLMGRSRAELAKHRLERKDKADERGERAAQQAEENRQKWAEAAKGKLWQRFYQEYFQKLSPVIRRVKETVNTIGHKLLPGENPIFALEELGHLRTIQHVFLKDKIAPITRALDKAGITWRNFARTLELDRILNGDRFDVANPAAHGPVEAAELLHTMRQAMTPAQRTVLDDQVEAFRDAFQEITEAAIQAGLYTDEVADLMRTNRAYATYRVIEYMDKHPTAKIFHQVGTLSDVGNVANGTILKALAMIHATAHQKARIGVVQFLDQHHRGDREHVQPRWNDISKKWEHAKSDRPDLELLTYYEKGKVRGVLVPNEIALAVKHLPVGMNMAAVRILDFINSAWFRRVFITVNLAFQARNLLRDFFRYIKAPGITVRGAASAYKQALPIALARVGTDSKSYRFGQKLFGQAKMAQALKDVSEAELAHIFTITHNQFAGQSHVETDELQQIMKSGGVPGFGTPAKPPAHPLASGLHKLNKLVRGKELFENLATLGDIIESLPKAAAAKEIASKGGRAIVDLTEEERSNIRNFVGTPDIMAGGIYKPLTNNLFLFSATIFNSWRYDAILATTREPGVPIYKTTAAGWWYKTAIANILPKMLTFAMVYAPAATLAKAMLGLGGGDDDKDEGFIDSIKEMQHALRKVSEYDLATYQVIPLAFDGNKAVYLRLPMDDAGRFISGVLWKTLHLTRGNKEVQQVASDLVRYTVSQLPQMTPAVGVIQDTVSYLSGQNIRDTFRDRDLYTRTEMEANDLAQKFGKFMLYEFQEVGGTIVWRMAPYETWKQLKEGSAAQKALVFPFLGPALQAYVRSSDYGEIEKGREAGDTARMHEAREKLGEDVMFDRLLGELKKRPPALRSEGAIEVMATRAVREMYPDAKPARREQEVESLVAKLKMGMVKGEGDRLTSLVMSQGTNRQKVATLTEYGLESMSRGEMQQWLARAVRNKVISEPIADEVRRVMRTR